MKKAGKVGLIILFLFFSTKLTFAQDKVEAIDEALNSIEQRSQGQHIDDIDKPDDIAYDFEIGTEYAAFRYEEPSIDIKDEADMYSLIAAVSGRSKAKALIGRMEGRFGYGRVYYDGSLNDGTPFTDEGDDYIIELRALIGRDLQLTKTILTPYFGFGYRYLNDHLESQYAYQRHITYYYCPIGFKTETSLFPTWSWGINLEYDIFLAGSVKSCLSDITPVLDDVTNNQDKGLGARCSIYLKKEINKELSFAVEPFFRYWDIQDSDINYITALGYYIVGIGYEPANSTKEYGIKMNLFW